MTDDAPNPFLIDEGRLDREWLRQPTLTRRAGIREADAQHEVAQAKAQLAVIEAEVRQAIRRKPEKFGVEPGSRGLTDSAIKEAVALSREYRAAVANLNDKEHDCDICRAEVAAMMDRRRALERLVELLAMDYYAEPRAREGDSREWVSRGAKDAARGPVRRPEKGTDV